MATTTGITAAQAAQPAHPGAADDFGATTVPAKILPNSVRQHSSRTSGGEVSSSSMTTNWAGYVASGDTYTSVSANWTQPAVLCSSKGIVSFWIGLDGWGDGTVEQDGTGVDCRSGSPSYYAWWETYPTNSQQTYGVTVAPGDNMSSTVSYANGNYTLALTDKTQNWSRTTTVAAPSAAKNASAEVVTEAASVSGAVTVLPNFGSAAFTGASINGDTLQDVSAQSIDMANSSGSVIAKTGAADTTGAFAVSYTGGSNVHAAFQSDAGSLYVYSVTGNANQNAAMMAGTSPSITTASTGYEVAYQDNTGQLVLVGTGGTFDTGQIMMAGTSPSIAALSGAGFEVAFQSGQGLLLVYSSATNTTTSPGLGMYAGTSPSITPLSGGGFEVAFEANTSQLWMYTSAAKAWTVHLGMMSATSPSITTLASGAIEIAFQANTGYLWAYSVASGGVNEALGMASTTSPGIAASSAGDFAIAIQANTGILWTYSSASGYANQNQPIMSGTSPDIAAASTGGYEMAIQAANSDFLVYGSAGAVDTRQNVLTGTGPSISS